MHAVNWQEGMFLRPHHFQAAHRFLAQTSQRNGKWDSHYNWGLRALELDLDSLANHRIVVRSLQARFRDGTLLSVPDDVELAPLNLKPELAQAANLTVYLALPIFSLGQANAGTQPFARFKVDTVPLEDENTGVNPQSIPFRQLNAQLLCSTRDLQGYEILPIVRLEKSQRAEATPQVDESFIPSVLSCDAWPGLEHGILRSIYERVGKKIDNLAGQVTRDGLTFDSQGQGQALLLHQLRELNEAFTVLAILAFTPGIHPRRAYQELCRVAGQLAIFGAARRVLDLPPYDHDDLARGFRQVKQQIDGFLDIVVEPQYKERAFVGAGMRMQVPLEPFWLEAGSQLFVGANSSLEAKDTVALLAKQGLDMKIGSSDRVDAIYRQGSAGLKFSHVPRPPRELPAPPGQVYFQIAVDPLDAEWPHVQKSLNLALRLNENFVLGNIQGQRLLTIKKDGKNIPMQFTLYVVPAAKK